MKIARHLAIGLQALGLSLLVCACASDKYLASPGHSQFHRRDFAAAAQSFAKDAAEPSTNQLLFMLDEATALEAEGKYDEAIKIFLRAEDLAAIKDYTSISEEVGTLVTNDNIRGYKGEDFEKVLINVYLGLSYAALGKIEDAQVEARKINNLLYRMIHEGKRNYQESPFARYLSAMLWEASGDFNNAFIDYKKTFELDPGFPELGSDILATAKKMGADEYQDWSKKFPGMKPREIPKADGELVVIFERGYGPIKVPRGNNSSLPMFIRRYSEDQSARVRVNGESVGNTHTVLDIEGLSIRYLEDRIGRMMAAKVAGLAAKGALAYGVGKLAKSEDLGILAFYLLAATDRADLRSWQSLPADLEMTRVPVKPGKYSVDIDVLGKSGQVLYTKSYAGVEIRGGRKVFLTAR